MPDYQTYTNTPPKGYTVIHTLGKPKPKGMLHDEKIIKKRMDKINPVIWKQLSAAARGTKVNHLGRGHARPPVEGPGYTTDAIPGV